MENEEVKQDTLFLKANQFFIKYLPLFSIVFVALIIGLSMIGNFYAIEIGEEVRYFHLYDLIAGDIVGIKLTLFVLFNYIIIPVIAAILLNFHKINKNFAFVSLFLFLLCSIVSIITKDVVATLLTFAYDVDVSVDKVYLCSIIPIIGYFVLSGIVLSFSINHTELTTRDITESGVLIAIALGLNFIKLFPAPTGGSVNLQMLPLFYLALRRGPLKGFIGCGIVYGIISCLTDGWGFAYFPFDYLLGFGGASFMGYFSKYIFSDEVKNYNIKGEVFLFIGGVGATIIRFIGGTVSSMIFYSLDIASAMLYNVGYVFISGGMALAILMVLYGPLIRVHKRFPPQKHEVEVNEASE